MASSPEAHRPLFSRQLLTFAIFDVVVSVVFRRPTVERQRQKDRGGAGGKAPTLTTETRRLSASAARSGHERPAGQATRLTGLPVLLPTLPASLPVTYGCPAWLRSLPPRDGGWLGRASPA